MLVIRSGISWLSLARCRELTCWMCSSACENDVDTYALLSGAFEESLLSRRPSMMTRPRRAKALPRMVQQRGQVVLEDVHQLISAHHDHC